MITTKHHPIIEYTERKDRHVGIDEATAKHRQAIIFEAVHHLGVDYVNQAGLHLICEAACLQGQAYIAYTGNGETYENARKLVLSDQIRDYAHEWLREKKGIGYMASWGVRVRTYDDGTGLYVTRMQDGSRHYKRMRVSVIGSPKGKVVYEV